MTKEAESSLTIVALAWNEAKYLGPCFESAQPIVESTGAHTLVVLDHEADKATEVAARHVAERVVTSRFVNFAAQRNRALELATTEWVFFIDPDERCTPELAEEIAEVLGRKACAAWRVPRRNFLFGREVRHTGWWPDYQTRLMRREQARYDESRHVHEYPIVQGETCTLLHPMIHFNYETWSQFVRKQRAYAPLEAKALYDSGIRARRRSLVGQPVREFARRLVDYEGYKDGWLGIALSLAMAAYRAEVYRQLRRLERRSVIHKVSTY